MKLRRSGRPDYTRPNQARAVGVFGEIGPELVAGLSPRILELRSQSLDPITLLIDSPGGSVYSADVIWNLLVAPDDARRRPMTTGLCVAEAGSAAADLLSRCDYAVVYPHSHLLIHGVRRPPEWITEEEAAETETVLRKKNEDWAQALAPHVFRRLLDNYGRLSREFPRIRRQHSETFKEEWSGMKRSDIDVFAFGLALREKVTAPSAEILGRNLGHLGHWRHLSDETWRIGKQELPKVLKDLVGRRKPEERRLLRLQLGAFHALVANRLFSDEEWQLTPENLERLTEDFRHLLEMIDPYFRDEVLNVLLDHAEVFFSENELDFVRSVHEKEYEASRKIRTRFDAAVGRAYERILPIYSFVIVLCRELQRGENELPPADAWWMGLIDEVQGTDLRRRQAN
jgi:ATP-dependent protease ClpP protease subunit